MKKTFLIITAIFFSVLNLSAQIPQTISWQGILQDADSKNLSGTYSLTVKLYDVATGGTAIWNETHSSVVIVDGLVNLTLGSVTPFSINFADEYWLEITVGTGTPLPRIKLSSVPYALHSKTAESITGSITESDPLFTASPASGILNTDITNWNAAYSWGDHSTEGYLKSFTEMDPLFSASPAAGILNTDILNWNTAHSWGDHSTEGYLKSFTETDPVFSASASAGISNTDISNWNNAHGWGDHSTEGYLKSYTETDPKWNGEANPDSSIYRKGNVGIGTETPSALLHINGIGTGEGSVLFVGEYKSTDPGEPPAQGAGTRMMWYPDKAAFRVGGVTATQWDKDSIGIYSIAMGYNSKARGSDATAIGYNTKALGKNSMALGFTTTASGFFSTAIGNGATAKSAFETAVGGWNTDYEPSSTTSWNPNDRLFVIGSGFDSPSDAMVVLKNGNIGIGTSTPSALLHTLGQGQGEGNVLHEGEYKGTNPGDPPASGTGTRMMWYPDKGAFRAGYVGGTAWDKNNIGNYSVALGYGSIAQGLYSFAAGGSNSASGQASVALGNGGMASGDYAFAMGAEASADGDYAFAMGTEVNASGNFSVAIGGYLNSTGEASVAMGMENSATGDYSAVIGFNLSAPSHRMPKQLLVPTTKNIHPKKRILGMLQTASLWWRTVPAAHQAMPLQY
ncbi:MAG: hypothetical protein M9949_12290 [Candidatus Kapabacteria bacterium]|nr:hypothetical protein [Candidatus Kapabacteria bacterium]